MPGSVKCPHCGLINPRSAERCDCGYDFTTQRPPSRQAQNTPPNTLPPNPASRSQAKSGGKFTLFIVFLAIPLVALIAAQGIEWRLDSNLRKALLQQYPDKTAQIEAISVSSVCNDATVRADKAFADICDLNDKMGLMSLGAILGAVVSLGLLGAIRLSGGLARRKRTLLLWLFAPGLHLSMLIVSALMVLYAALGIAAIYYGGSFLGGMIPIGMILALSLGGFIGVASMIRAQFSAFGKATTTAVAKTLKPTQYKTIWGFVTDLASSMGAQQPDMIIAGLEPNFYVTEANVLCLDGKLHGRTMYLSVPLCRILSIEELNAVLGHELAHYKGMDTRFSKRFYPIYRGATKGLQDIASGLSGKGTAGHFVLLPAFMILAYFLGCFSKAEHELSRERELIADGEAAKTAGARPLAAALIKIYGFSPAWPVVKNAMEDAIQHGKMLINASTFFADLVNSLNPQEALRDVSEEGPVHPTDTHPPLAVRLENLGMSLPEVQVESCRTQPNAPANNLLGDNEALEIELTDCQQALMIRASKSQ